MFRRISSAIILIAAALALLVAAWPQLFDLHREPIAAQVVAMRGLAASCAVGLIVILLLIALAKPSFRRFCGSLGLLLVVFIALSAIVLATRGFGDRGFQTRNPADVTVLSWNTLGDAPSAQVIASLAIDNEADIVSLPETTEAKAIEVAQLMKQSGRPMWVHSANYDLISKARSTSLLISVDLGEYSVDAVSSTTSVLPSIVATPTNGSGPTIVAVHAVAPIPEQFANWKRDLNWIAKACAGRNVIMAGDFNSTIDNYTGLASQPGAALGNCFDAAADTGNAAVGTWPSSLPALIGSPIDHIMATSGWRVTGMRVIETGDIAASDHRPILAQLTPSGRE